MHLVPTNAEVIAMLRETGALREGHFEYPTGMHANEYLEVALAFRYYQYAKILSVGLSRRLRADTEIRAIIKDLSIVCPNTGGGGLPVAYGVCEALRAHQVYWSEQDDENSPQRFRQFLKLTPGDRVLLVDDILRSGRRLTALRTLVESQGGIVAGLAVAVYQPNPDIADFGNLPLFYLAQMDATYYKDSSTCELCHRGVPVEKILRA
ncbi:MAG TPA: phosphoribosyltransferase family protein [Bryobacteraceae bacterium]|jgi:orotate phosphoribosyltransferase|nr:phosphoribosyltransferase family protein [Bryobacteraceae bacterium]